MMDGWLNEFHDKLVFNCKGLILSTDSDDFKV